MGWKIAVTGHRPNKLYGYNLYDPQWIKLGVKMRNFIIDRLRSHDSVECITGMALGVDQLFGLVALKLKTEGKPVRIFCALPCRGQETVWKDKRYWQKIFDCSDEHYYVHDGPYTRTCMNERNAYMVDRCDEILAVWDGTPGGTGNCIKIARNKNKSITNLFEK